MNEDILDSRDLHSYHLRQGISPPMFVSRLHLTLASARDLLYIRGCIHTCLRGYVNRLQRHSSWTSLNPAHTFCDEPAFCWKENAARECLPFMLNVLCHCRKSDCGYYPSVQTLKTDELYPIATTNGSGPTRPQTLPPFGNHPGCTKLYICSKSSSAHDVPVGTRHQPYISQDLHRKDAFFCVFYREHTGSGQLAGVDRCSYFHIITWKIAWLPDCHLGLKIDRTL